MKFGIVDLVDPPSKPYMSVFPKDGSAYDYRFLQEENGKWEPWTVDVAAAEPIPKVKTQSSITQSDISSMNFRIKRFSSNDVNGCLN